MKEKLLTLCLLSGLFGCATAPDPIIPQITEPRVERDDEKPIPLLDIVIIGSDEETLVRYAAPLRARRREEPSTPNPFGGPCYTHNPAQNPTCILKQPVNPKTGKYEPLPQDPDFGVHSVGEAIFSIPLQAGLNGIGNLLSYSSRNDQEEKEKQRVDSDAQARSAMGNLTPFF